MEKLKIAIISEEVNHLGCSEKISIPAAFREWARITPVILSSCDPFLECLDLTGVVIFSEQP